ncbi:MAG: MATE family efflux transporter, partial [bacterium]
MMNNRIGRALLHYPWDYMLLIFVAWGVPAAYGLLNRYFIGYMTYESIVVEQSYEALEVAIEVLLEMVPLAVLALVARNIENKRNVFSIVQLACAVQIIITAIFVLISLSYTKGFIDWIKTPESARSLAEQYFRIKVFAVPFQAMGLIFLIAIKSQRRGWLAAGLSFIGVFVNFVLDAIFISNYSFSLKLGLIGSAWNNIISNFVLVLIAGFTFVRITKTAHYQSSESRPFVRNQIFNLGVWSGLESFIRNLGYIVGVVAVVNFIGAKEPNAIGGYNTTMSVMWAVTLIPILAWTEATNIAIGNAYGKRDKLAMKDIQLVSIGVMSLYMFAWTVVGSWIWVQFSSWLNSEISSDVVSYSQTTFKYLIIPYALFAIGSGIKAVFIGTGRFYFVFIASAVV